MHAVRSNHSLRRRKRESVVKRAGGSVATQVRKILSLFGDTGTSLKLACLTRREATRHY